MTVAELNALSRVEAGTELARCCGSTRWVEAMLASRPFADQAAVLAAADTRWVALDREDWLEAFTHHPRIGDLSSLRAKFANTKVWASGEQAGASDASEEVLQALAAGNQAYEAKFDYIFIVCATGKSADDMRQILEGRLLNEPAVELAIAADEQQKITRLRLEKLLA